MADDQFTRIRTTQPDAGVSGPAPPKPPDTVNELAELILDLVEPTGLVPVDRLAAMRGQIGKGSVAQALRDAGLASDEGVARALAERYHLVYVDIRRQDVAAEAVELIPLAVLQRVGALPYRLDGNTLHVAIADPADVVSIDELRLATSYTLEIAVAPREDLVTELARFSRGGPTLDVRVGAEIRAIEEEEEEGEDENDDLEVDDGFSDAPLVRLVNAVIYQAAEDGASDIHVEP